MFSKVYFGLIVSLYMIDPLCLLYYMFTGNNPYVDAELDPFAFSKTFVILYTRINQVMLFLMIAMLCLVFHFQRVQRDKLISSSNKIIAQMDKNPKTWLQVLESEKKKPTCTECAICLADYEDNDKVC